MRADIFGAGSTEAYVWIEDNMSPDPIPNTPGRSELVDIFSVALDRLKKTILDPSLRSGDRRKVAQRIIEIQDHIKELKQESAEWAAKYIPKAYKYGAYQDQELIERLAKYRKTPAKTAFGRYHKQAAKVAAEGAAADFAVAADALEKTFVNYVRRIQIETARQAIAREISAGIVEGATRETTTSRLMKVLEYQAKNGIITVGKTTMAVDQYADMLCRTLTRAARTDGVLNRAKENNIDLVIINNTGAVDFCREYEDQIFSISGRDSRFPVLTERPPFHPNCTHSISLFAEEFAEPDEIELGRQFNKSDIGKPASEMAKKYGIEEDDTRAMTRKTQKASA